MARLVEALVPARMGRDFRWLLASTWSTNLGDGIAVAAGPLLVASLTDDPFLVSLAALLRWAPPLVFGLWAGALSDRLNRRRIILVANVVRAFVLTALIVAVVTGRVSVGTALVALGLLAVTEVFADNTTTTLAPMLVHRDDLAIANARLLTGLVTANRLAGPPIGAALFAAGRAWPLVTEAVLVAAALFFVSRIRLPAVEASPVRGRVWRDMVEGVMWTVRHPAVRTLSLTILIFNVTYGAAWSLLVLYAERRLGLGAVGFGLLMAVSAVGGLMGTAMYGALTRRVSLGNLMRAGLVIETLTHLGLAVTTSPWFAAALLFVFGAHEFVWGTTSLTIRQRAVPAHLQGRVNSVNTISTYGGLVVGSALGGLLGTYGGTTAPFWFAFGGSTLFVLLLWGQLSRIAHDDEQAQLATASSPAPTNEPGRLVATNEQGEPARSTS